MNSTSWNSVRIENGNRLIDFSPNQKYSHPSSNCCALIRFVIKNCKTITSINQLQYKNYVHTQAV